MAAIPVFRHTAEREGEYIPNAPPIGTSITDISVAVMSLACNYLLSLTGHM